MRFPRPQSFRSRSARAGFTLVELMITLVMLAMVVAVIATVLIASGRSKADTEGRVEAQQSGRAISDMITADLRCAGYMVDDNTVPHQPPFAYVDSMEILLNANLSPISPDTMSTGPLEPKALNPGLSPMPPRLTGSYVPAATYVTGAETIRYTLDINNDGVVDANDQAAPLAEEAQRTGNPNDFVLARAIYGVQSGNNGGSLEKIGLVRGPATGVPPIFTVYLGGNVLPWNWHNGAIPPSELKNISRIVLQVTTEGRRPFKDGTYPRATLTTEVNSIRNTPEAATTTYNVSGFVFKDVNRNGSKDTGEPGVANAIMRLGGVGVAQSSVTGSYSISAVPGIYVLRQTPPPGYGTFGPDTLNIDWVNTPVNVTRNFADTALVGGWLNDTSYVDTNLNGMFDAYDERVDGVTIAAGSTNGKTNGNGGVSLFIAPGTWTVYATAPDSYVVASTNPATISITNGGTVNLFTRLVPSGTGTVTGFVYNDLNKNGTKDTGEGGLPGVWVGVTKDAGMSYLGYATSDVNGQYSISVPNNMPAATTPYSITVIPPPGNYPTTSTSISPVWVATGATVSGNNFGMVTFTSFSLTADRVLALGTAVLLPYDWSGNASQWSTKGAFRKDLILCSEYASAPNISVWWNRMPTLPPFLTDPTYQRNALSSALSITAGSIDTSTTAPNVFLREDIITGLAAKPSGNIAIWMTQNTSSNEGQLVSATSTPTGPTLYQTNDNGDANQVLLTDCAGGPALDLIVGTKSTAYSGTLEVWRGAGNGTFSRDEIYPPQGNLPGGTLGEVKAMTLADVTGDGVSDLMVGTRTGDGQGMIHIMRINSRSSGNRYRAVNNYSVVGEVTSLVMSDVDGDGVLDMVVGTRISSVAGNVQLWRGLGSGSFAYVTAYVAPGPVLSLCAADLGGTSRNDIIFGYRDNESVYSGGVRILFTDLGGIPVAAVDPANTTSSYMTTSVVSANFNFRLNNTTPGPYYADLAVAQKTGATQGALLVFVR